MNKPGSLLGDKEDICSRKQLYRSAMSGRNKHGRKRNIQLYNTLDKSKMRKTSTFFRQQISLGYTLATQKQVNRYGLYKRANFQEYMRQEFSHHLYDYFMLKNSQNWRCRSIFRRPLPKMEVKSRKLRKMLWRNYEFKCV